MFSPNRKECRRMRKMMIMLLIQLGMLPVFAHHASSRLNVRSIDGSQIAVKLQSRWYESYDNVVRVDALPPGDHRIRIFKFIWSDYDCRNIRQLAYDGYVYIPRNTKVVAKLDYYNRMHVKEVPLNVSRVSREIVPMDHYQFVDLVHAVQTARFERDRLIIARSALSRNFVTSQQTLELMELMNFENSRVKVAKRAYERTVDPENFHIVYQAFHFGSSIRELERFYQ